MQPFLRGFSDELVKLSADSDMKNLMRGTNPNQHRDYLASALIGALSIPLVGLVGKKISRTIHNLEVEKVMKGMHTPVEIERMKGELHLGPLLGHARPDLPASRRPSMTYGDLISDATKGVLMSSVVQMLRDRFSSSNPRPRPQR